VKIAVLDLGICNVGSVGCAIDSLGYPWELVRSTEEINLASHLVLPGVGAFWEGAARLDTMGVRQAIVGHYVAGRPLLGICLGMHLLADAGAEGGKADGLGIIHGGVDRLKGDGVRLPHIGWNEINLTGVHPILEGIKEGVDFYFAHTYRMNCRAACSVVAESDHGEQFPAIAASSNAVGVQFHPEKSQKNGLRVLENFCRWDGG